MAAPRKRYLVVIPARGGSKRLPGKNLMKIGDDSLIGCAILCAKDAGIVGDIAVSTDDQSIATEAMRYGPYVPFMRPKQLATDEAKTIDVVDHAIKWFASRGNHYDALVVLQPTSPLRTAKDLREAVELFEQREADAVVSVCMLEHPLQWCAELGPNGSMEKFGETHNSQMRSQELTHHYRLNGAIYIYDITSLRAKGRFYFNDNTFAYEMDEVSSVDIDTHHDYLMAEYFYSIR
ncbi:acylneuraminate cytidylyltransferase family protein [Halomonas sp. CSM-2]|uniref:acylneuraminate cytidylyltransferase family protein n=1 Tax=Halomonas sp. CSM-2 TaxID=1975722 RepID=UPI000A2813B9|nr:acylneuraminate cytidylyltransferase family protein [Halomonas sp. CSM-2]